MNSLGWKDRGGFGETLKQTPTKFLVKCDTRESITILPSCSTKMTVIMLFLVIAMLVLTCDSATQPSSVYEYCFGNVRIGCQRCGSLGVEECPKTYFWRLETQCRENQVCREIKNCKAECVLKPYADTLNLVTKLQNSMKRGWDLDDEWRDKTRGEKGGFYGNAYCIRFGHLLQYFCLDEGRSCEVQNTMMYARLNEKSHQRDSNSWSPVS